MTFIDAARTILMEASEPLSTGEIVRCALERGLLETKGKTPDRTLYTQLLTATRKAGSKSEFVLVSRGRWALTGQQAERPLVPESQEPRQQSQGNGYWFLTTNPRLYDIEELLQKGEETWGQVLKGGLARKRIREEIREGDVAFVYRSRPSAEVVCEVEVSAAPYLKQGKPLFDVKPLRRIEPPIPLQRLRACPDLQQMEFLRNPQVSISRLTDAEYGVIQRLIEQPGPLIEDYTHDQVQWYLITIGEAHDCAVWVAPDCRKRAWEGNVFADHCLGELPRLGLDEETVALIRNIDVLWLRRNRIIAAFEIEHTTSIYSGLLRLADLVALQPNTRIDSYIIAPSARRSAVRAQVDRPAFRSLETRLSQVCHFISYDRLAEVYETAKRWGGSLRVDIKSIAEDSVRSGN